MSRRLWVKIAVIAIVVIVGVLIYASFDPSNSKFFPKCPFLLLTGLKCPGCGTQRAIHALLSGNLAAAWHFNALMVISIPYLALLFAGLATRKRHPRFNNIINSVPVIITVFVLVVGWWILRNICGW